MLHGALRVFGFELRRTLTAGRTAIWFGLWLLPAVLVATLRVQSRGNIPDEAMAIVCFALVPQISCMLGLLLWATPAIGSELEAQSWIHLALRSSGRTSVVIGKYLVAVLWTISYSVPSSILVSVLSGIEDWSSLTIALVSLSCLSSLAYGGLYLLIGTAVYRRATVVAVVYSLILEGLVSWVPAAINQATVSYRLRSLLAEWTIVGRIVEQQQAESFFGDEPAVLNVLILILYTLMCLVASLLTVQYREYPVQTDA